MKPLTPRQIQATLRALELADFGIGQVELARSRMEAERIAYFRQVNRAKQARWRLRQKQAEDRLRNPAFGYVTPLCHNVTVNGHNVEFRADLTRKTSPNVAKNGYVTEFLVTPPLNGSPSMVSPHTPLPYLPLLNPPACSLRSQGATALFGEPIEEKTTAKPTEKPSPRKTSSDLKGDDLRWFEDTWWPAYPHKVGKGSARQKMTLALRKGCSRQQLFEGVQAYIRSKPLERAWCNPATWLHEERWLDAPAVSGALPVSAASKPMIFIERGSVEWAAWSGVKPLRPIPDPRNTSRLGTFVPSRLPLTNGHAP
jgi:hypothetical protein